MNKTKNFYLGMQDEKLGHIYIAGRLFANVYLQSADWFKDNKPHWVVNKAQVATDMGFDSAGLFFLELSDVLPEIQEWYDKNAASETEKLVAQLTPSRFRFQSDGFLLGSEVTIEERRQIDGDPLWAVLSHGSCLNKAGGWELEVMPSSRTDAFVRRCRFKSVEAAIKCLLGSPFFDKTTLQRKYENH